MSEKAIGNYIREEDVDNWGIAISDTHTFATTDVNKTDNKITVGLDIPTGSKIRFTSTGVLPGGLESGVIYYAIKSNTTIIQVASSSVNASAGEAINLTDVGVGTHTIDVGEGETLANRQAVIDAVEAQGEQITHDYFYPKTFLDLLNGNGRDRIFLPIRQKILSINYLAVNTITLSTTDLTGENISGTAGAYTVTLTISTTADYYKNYYLGIKDYSETIDKFWGCRILSNTATDENGKSVFTLEKPLKMTLVTTPAEEADTVSIITNWAWDQDCIYRNPKGITHEPGTLMEPAEFFIDNYFPKGVRNVEVKGTIGHYTCPQAIKDACIILARHENDSSLYTSYSEFKSEKLGDYSYTKDNGHVYLTGVSEADIKIKPYINNRIIMTAV